MASLFARMAAGFERARVVVGATLTAYAGAVMLAVIAAVCFVLMAGLEYSDGHPERIPVVGLYLGSWLLIFALPVMLVWSHLRRQKHVITKVRSLYALASEYLMTGRDQDARRVLRSIRRWEQHWRIGNGSPYRFAYSTFVIGATTLVAGAHQVAYLNLNSHRGYGQVPQETLGDTVNHIAQYPLLGWFIGGMSLLYALGALGNLKDLAGKPWAEFYGDRLAAVLRAGKTINEAPWHDAPMPEDNVSARELLGLPERFTSAQLRRAWLDLVRELHPDRWAMAGDSVRTMKEAALKRVNAARDELAAQVCG